MSTPPDERVVLAELGEQGLANLVRAFYERVRNDDLLAPMYRAHLEHSGETWEQAEGRLRDFLIYRFGGSKAYVEERGHPRLRMRHMAFAIDLAAAQRWLALMGGAMDDALVSPAVRAVLQPYFRNTALFMINRED